MELKDIRVPTELCRALATEAEAARNADAKVVSASGEFEVRELLSSSYWTICPYDLTTIKLFLT